MFPEEIEALARRVLDLARTRGLMLATAESCTGGLVAGALTAIAGSSDVVAGAIVSYSNAAKMGVLGVDSALLAAHGAVSEQAARAMAQGAVKALGVDLAVAITGVAGPGGGSADKPVGLVCFASAQRNGQTLATVRRYGDIGREEVRLASVKTALGLFEERLADER